jgi:fucose permease
MRIVDPGSNRFDSHWRGAEGEAMTGVLPTAGTVDLARARTAVVLAFGINGFCFASWLSRTPSARDALQLSPVQLGLLLLCLSGGACVALPFSGPLVQRIGPARTVLLGSVLMSVGLLAMAAGLAVRSVWPVAGGLLVTGLGNASWDVAMNVAGADVERRRGRSLMPRLHAAYSLGTVASGGVGAGSAALGVPLAAQLVFAGALAPVSMVFAVRWFLPPHEPEPLEASASPWGGLSVWREPRTLLIGVLTLGFAFTEGSANDWLAVAMADGHHAGEVLAAVGFAVFVTAMTIGRICGVALLDRFGRVAVLRATATVAVAGLLLVILSGSVLWAMVGALLWGLGASLGFPVGMSAAADDPARAAARVSVVSTIAYTAFLAGPPLIGLLAQHTGILPAMYVVLAALVVAALVCPATRPPVDRT